MRKTILSRRHKVPCSGGQLLGPLVGAGAIAAAGVSCLFGAFGVRTCEHGAATYTSTAAAPLDERTTLDELVVDLDDQLSDREVGEIAARYGAELTPQSSYSLRDRIYRLRIGGPAGEARPQKIGRLQRLLGRLRGDTRVEAADFALIYQIPETAPGALTRPRDEALPVGGGIAVAPLDSDRQRFQPNDPKYRYQWHLDQIRMPEAWTRGRGDGVVVAVVDTGVTQVEDLQGTEFVPGWNFVTNGPDARDDHGHGTHVAGTIAQTTHNSVGVAGVAYNARIMPIKVLSAGGSGSVGGIAEGIRWAADHGAQVINMSLGGPFNSQVLAKAVKYAHDKGVVVVCAAGNDGRGRVSFPAANDGAIAVAATQFDEATTFYSNWGPEIDVAAPGGNTRLDQNQDGVPDGVLQNTVTPGNIDKQDYLLFMGTSMASPHVAGAAALLVGAGVKSPDEVERLLKRSSRKPAQYRGKRDNHYGSGIIDAAAALRLAQGAPDAVAAADAREQPARRSVPFGSVVLLLGLGLLAASRLLGRWPVATRSSLSE